MTLKEAARRIREHNRIHHLKEPLNSPLITEILETAAVMFEQIDAGMYKPVIHGHWEYEQDEGHGIYTGGCSVCGYRRRIDQFCGRCGAEMDEEGET